MGTLPKVQLLQGHVLRGVECVCRGSYPLDADLVQVEMEFLQSGVLLQCIGECQGPLVEDSVQIKMELQKGRVCGERLREGLEIPPKPQGIIAPLKSGSSFSEDVKRRKQGRQTLKLFP